jgi:hypothetical protein
MDLIEDGLLITRKSASNTQVSELIQREEKQVRHTGHLLGTSLCPNHLYYPLQTQILPALQPPTGHPARAPARCTRSSRRTSPAASRRGAAPLSPTQTRCRTCSFAPFSNHPSNTSRILSHHGYCRGGSARFGLRSLPWPLHRILFPPSPRSLWLS